MRLLPAHQAGRALLLGLCCLLIGSARPAAAQEADTAIRDRITSLYEQSQSARAVEDYTELLSELEAIEALEITESQTTYLQNLASWLLTERGRKRIIAADEAYNEEEDERGGQLDAQALADFESAIARNPENWKAYHHRSVSRATSRDYEGALADIDAALAITQGDALASDIDYRKLWFNQGKIHLELGHNEQAAESFTQLLEMTPDDSTAIIARGHAYLRMGQARQALNDFQRMVDRWPDSAVAVTARGEAHAALGQWNAAATDFRRAIESGAEYSTAYQRAAWFMATCPQEEFRQPELAIEAAEQAIELDPIDDWRSYDALAAAQARNGDFEAARDSIATAQTLAESDGNQAALAELAARAELYANDEPYTLPSP